ncbi:protein BatD [Francisella noatunensis]|uniref:Protein BatD n=1 Tax=Francisella noatunensis TaxID=657445 RepID=A0A9Q2KWL9_9GAMM|nr:BatD family protein [Francisella noatunensis]MBK2029399.1 protein BatD [Francisella noatunensis]MBK2033762.1 protein BatD [Francisella noatunensis]MBK2049273.1 protein BatD [Francisella noatunensis]MBK2050681.1 protein BatD [Francisella noatunensis]MBK2051282.1 protein BatD [Francisella noatunensis]
MRTKLLKLVSILLLLIAGLNISYANVTASVDNTHLEYGETFELILHLDDFDTQPDLDVLDKDFTVYNTSTSSKTTVINGKSSSQFEMIVTLMPNRSGNLTIPAIEVGNQSTKPISIKVDKKLSSEEASNYQDIFAIGTLATSETYVNVPVLYTLKLYYSTPILSLNPRNFDIKNSEIKQTNHRRTYQKRINGKMYDVVEESFLIIPHRTGTIAIPAIAMQATIPNTFGQLGTRVKSFSTDAKFLRVKPIPEKIAIKDWFPASDVKISDNWSAGDTIKEGELLTRTVTIKVKGVLSEDIPKLEFKSSDAFNVYSEKPVLEDIEQGGQLISTATYKIGYMPIKQGKTTVPAVMLKWFDIDNSKSQLATIAAKTFDVKKGTIPSTSFNANSQATTPQVIKKVVEDTFWRNVAVGLFVLWLITFMLLIRCKLTRKAKSSPKEAFVTDDKNSVNIKDIKKACAKRDNIQLQKAIIGWANTKSNKQLFSLLEVAEIFTQLKEQLKSLNASIYAGKSFSNYQELLSLIKSTTKNTKSKSDTLVKGLYE